MATAVTKSTCTVQCGVTLWTNMNMASPPAHRLLYRGALSLPDSHLLLDGLTFFAPSHSAGLNLLQNPLALALESMRGRQSLSFLGIEKLRDVWIDASGDVCMLVLQLIFYQNHHTEPYLGTSTRTRPSRAFILRMCSAYCQTNLHFRTE